MSRLHNPAQTATASQRISPREVSTPATAPFFKNNTAHFGFFQHFRARFLRAFSQRRTQIGRSNPPVIRRPHRAENVIRIQQPPAFFASAGEIISVRDPHICETACCFLRCVKRPGVRAIAIAPVLIQPKNVRFRILNADTNPPHNAPLPPNF